MGAKSGKVHAERRMKQGITMATKAGLLFFCMSALSLMISLATGFTIEASLTRKSFPSDFIFGAGSAAYQYEGAAQEDGRGATIWDTFTERYSEKISDQSNGIIADDFYHRYKEDVKLMKEMGLDSFRFSISWSRILPRGTITGGVNHLGIKFYNNLINELLANGIKPFVTIFHWDLPQALQDEYGGFLNHKIVEDFKDFADLCFETFGDRVKHWTTVNEPNLSTWQGYAYGVFAPGRCSNYIGNCSVGNSATEPYIVGHHLLLCHAAAVQLYRQKFQASQNGIIGMALATTWILPIDETSASQLAASRALDFSIGWFVDPIMNGDYPKTMRAIVGQRLPYFTEAQSKMLKQSFDFIGLNYYTSYYAANSPRSNSEYPSYTTDNHATLTAKNNDGVLIGEPTQVSWLFIYPKGIQDIVLHFKEKYNNPTLIITENGMGESSSLAIEEAIKDNSRIKYHEEHLYYLHRSIKEGANVKGYFIWSFLDDFEWNSGYTTRFGLYLVDYRNGLKRYEKRSALWFKKFLANSLGSNTISVELKKTIGNLWWLLESEVRDAIAYIGGFVFGQ